mgnify:CR=1 FL=1
MCNVRDFQESLITMRVGDGYWIEIKCQLGLSTRPEMQLAICAEKGTVAV